MAGALVPRAIQWDAQHNSGDVPGAPGDADLRIPVSIGCAKPEPTASVWLGDGLLFDSLLKRLHEITSSEKTISASLAAQNGTSNSIASSEYPGHDCSRSHSASVARSRSHSARPMANCASVTV
jgi:hypothetical protein